MIVIYKITSTLVMGFISYRFIMSAKFLVPTFMSSNLVSKDFVDWFYSVSYVIENRNVCSCMLRVVRFN
jgi:hypothetical protein